MTQLRWKYPLEYELTPEVIDKGIHWLTLKLKNIGGETITGLDVRLHSLDTFNLSVYDTGHYVPALKPKYQKAKRIIKTTQTKMEPKQ